MIAQRSGVPFLVREGAQWSIGGVEMRSGRQDTHGIADPE
jgi:hypothetical protein